MAPRTYPCFQKRPLGYSQGLLWQHRSHSYNDTRKRSPRFFSPSDCYEVCAAGRARELKRGRVCVCVCVRVCVRERESVSVCVCVYLASDPGVWLGGEAGEVRGLRYSCAFVGGCLLLCLLRACLPQTVFVLCVLSVRVWGIGFKPG